MILRLLEPVILTDIREGYSSRESTVGTGWVDDRYLVENFGEDVVNRLKERGILVGPGHPRFEGDEPDGQA